MEGNTTDFQLSNKNVGLAVQIEEKKALYSRFEQKSLIHLYYKSVTTISQPIFFSDFDFENLQKVNLTQCVEGEFCSRSLSTSLTSLKR